MFTVSINLTNCSRNQKQIINRNHWCGWVAAPLEKKNLGLNFVQNPDRNPLKIFKLKPITRLGI
ncbi:hypothetical protein Hanom_Chr08g00743851 [Helianthus anomalus]